jgi:hypothetical protein
MGLGSIGIGVIWAESPREIATFVLGQVADLALEFTDVVFGWGVDLLSRDGWVSNLDTLIAGRQNSGMPDFMLVWDWDDLLAESTPGS